MKNNGTRSKVEESLQRSKEWQQAKDKKEDKKEERKEDVGAFTAIRTAYSTDKSTSNYSIRSSWILDNGSNNHVCNSTMQSRFVRQWDGGGDYLTVGTQRLPIECYGTIGITVQTPTGPKNLTLLNVAYVADFMTNLVSQDLLYVKGLYFDNWKLHLHREGTTIATVNRHNGHYLLEDNVNGNDTQSAAATSPASKASPAPSPAIKASTSPPAPTNNISYNSINKKKPEGVKRHLNRRQAYSNALIKTTTGEIEANHAILSANIRPNFYSTVIETSPPTHNSLTQTSLPPERHKVFVSEYPQDKGVQKKVEEDKGMQKVNKAYWIDYEEDFKKNLHQEGVST